MKLKLVLKGGAGSGNFDHAGRPGKEGGSAAGSGSGSGKSTAYTSIEDSKLISKLKKLHKAGNVDTQEYQDIVAELQSRDYHVPALVEKPMTQQEMRRWAKANAPAAPTKPRFR